MLVIHNTSKPESVLKKKSNSVCYHAVHNQWLWASHWLDTYLATKMSQMNDKKLTMDKDRYLVGNISYGFHHNH